MKSNYEQIIMKSLCEKFYLQPLSEYQDEADMDSAIKKLKGKMGKGNM